MENEIKEYTVTIYTENQIGLLAQITNVFTRHGLSIWSLSAGATSMEGVHNITIVTAGSEKKVRESVQQIEKRVDVIRSSSTRPTRSCTANCACTRCPPRPCSSTATSKPC